MVLRRLVRRLPPLSRRDEAFRELQDRHEKLRAKLAASAPWTPPSPERAVELIVRGGLFDVPWYRSQIHGPQPEEPVEHFVASGEAEALSPHPAFLSSYYLSQLSARARKSPAVSAAPYLHYLTVGAATGHSPSPLFDAAAYLEAFPDSAGFPGGPLGHFLAGGPPGPGTGLEDGPLADPETFLARARAAAEVLRDTRGFGHLERDVPEFDVELESRVKADLRRTPLPDDLPLVSIVIPTKDRAAMLSATLDSVVAQTYPRWELIVVDDGSRDATTDVLRHHADADDRVRVVRHEESKGVSAARNSALAVATGSYVAYLDSDNTWFPDFLELMVRHLLRTGAAVAYGATALVEEGGEGRRSFRALPFDREHLRERNFIDCIVLVHERALLERTGGFDESLRRNVDWDLFIRMAEHAEFSFVPILATQYDPWSERGERITTTEPRGFRYLVRQRTLVDLDALRATVGDRDLDVTSVVVGVQEGVSAEVVTTGVTRLLETATGAVEVVVVDARSSPEDFMQVHARLDGHPQVRLLRLSQPLTMEVARNVGVAATRGATLVFVTASMWAEPGWDAPLRDGLSRHAVVQPLVLSPGGSVWSAGAAFLATGDGYERWSGFAGDAREVRTETRVAAVNPSALAVSAESFLAVGGFDPLMEDDLRSGELSLRVTRAAGGSAARIPASTFAWRAVPREMSSLVRENQRRCRRQYLATGPGPGAESDAAADFATVGLAWENPKPFLPRPVLVHARAERPLRWSIKIGAPTVERRTNWGDTHFAESLRDALERLGHEVSVDCKDDWYRPTSHLDDVVLQLRGSSLYHPNPIHTNLIWVISHPDRVAASELSDYDLLFGASARWCAASSRRLRREVALLMQCTDQRRFRPVEPSGRQGHRVLAVANARGVRPSVAAALEAGVVPAVYGLRWDGLLPAGAWRGEYIPNEDLSSVYQAAGVVLNDHWDDMREHGLLSNRLFDLAACEARVVSDHLPEVDEVFGGSIVTFGEGRTMREALEVQLGETPERAEARRELGRRVRTEHTFDARAAQLSEAVHRLRARRDADGATRSA